ncbi:hypothetical protein C8J56DRAFT_1015958 [Mycena floridula]|nr:hypothetical protein C8J56DRAFT_1015958 [Mycena floridula]
MSKSTFLTLGLLIVSSFTVSVVSHDTQSDHIDLTVLDFLDQALAEITAVYEDTNAIDSGRRNVSRLGSKEADSKSSIIDVHTHVVPDWYKKIVPLTGGNPTPSWNISSYLSFMASEGIDYSVFSFSSPGANVYLGNKKKTVALARLINEQSAAYVRSYPTRLSFYAVVPLPYTAEAIAEAHYAIGKLGAAGIILTSNFEGLYLGDTTFKPFFAAIDAMGPGQILLIHPTPPYLRLNGVFVEANPTTSATATIEFYFETARTLHSLTLTQTIHNFTNINYIISHVGGAFPAVIDRALRSLPEIYNSSLAIFNSRFYWDSAGPTYYHQVGGLLAYGIPKTQLLFGTDFPYAPLSSQLSSLGAAAERTTVFRTSALDLFGKKINA